MYKVIVWNANGLQHKVLELCDFIRTENIDILNINETKLKPEIKIKIPNFFVYRSDRTRNRGGGVAILIRRSIPHIRIDNILSMIDNIAIKLSDDTVIRGVYNSPNHKITDNKLLELVDHNKIIIAGDLNARHTTWFNSRNNRNGNTVRDFADREGIAIIAPDTPTHFPSNNSSPSIIDILLNKNYLEPIIPSSLPLLCSDHNPVYFELDNTDRNVLNRKTYNYKTTNWTKYRQIINNKLTINNQIDATNDIENETRRLTKIICYSRNKTTRQTTIKPYEDSVPEDITKLISFKNKIKRIWQRNRREIDRLRLNDLQATITQKLKIHREETWNTKISSLTRQDKSLWRMTKLFKRPYKRIPTLVHNNVTYKTDVDKAEVFAKHLQTSNTTIPNSTAFHNNVTYNTNNLQDRYPIPPNKFLKIMTNLQKIKEIIKAFPNNKAPGPDTIPNILLKNLPTKALVQISYLINSILKLQFFPSS